VHETAAALLVWGRSICTAVSMRVTFSSIFSSSAISLAMNRRNNGFMLGVVAHTEFPTPEGFAGAQSRHSYLKRWHSSNSDDGALIRSLRIAWAL